MSRPRRSRSMVAGLRSERGGRAKEPARPKRRRPREVAFGRRDPSVCGPVAPRSLRVTGRRENPPIAIGPAGPALPAGRHHPAASRVFQKRACDPTVFCFEICLLGTRRPRRVSTRFEPKQKTLPATRPGRACELTPISSAAPMAQCRVASYSSPVPAARIAITRPAGACARDCTRSRARCRSTC